MQTDLNATYVTLIKNNEQWEIVTKKFPQYKNGHVYLLNEIIRTNTLYTEKEAAEAAARLFSAQRQLIYVNPGKSIITVVRVHGAYHSALVANRSGEEDSAGEDGAIELKRGASENNLEKTRVEALQRALNEDLFYIKSSW